MKKRNIVILFISGLVVIAVANIVSHFSNVSDTARGIFTGVGIGLLTNALILGSRQKRSIR